MTTDADSSEEGKHGCANRKHQENVSFLAFGNGEDEEREYPGKVSECVYCRAGLDLHLHPNPTIKRAQTFLMNTN